MRDLDYFPGLGPAEPLPFADDEAIVDLFAGGGGASLGIEMALGRSPDIAVNHDADAIRMHAVNHPATLHLQRNVWQVDPMDHVGHRRVGLLWASPDCKHHSKAKGGKPLKRNIRDLAWVVVHWAKRTRPRVIMLENVEEFRDWGPLTVDGRPCLERKGQTFAQWTGELRRLGYKVEHRELRACDYGAPTMRKRLFLIARRDGRKIVWPQPTHGDPKSPAVLAGKLLAWRTAAEVIDWSRPCPSIFLTKEEGRAIGCNRPLADNTMARIAKGVKRYVLESAKPFIVPVTHTGDARVHDVGDPLRTVTCAPRGEHAIIAPSFVGVAHGDSDGRREYSAEEPFGTVTQSQSRALVAPYLVPRYGERPGQEQRTRSVEVPMPVVVPTGNGGSLAAVHLSRQFGASVGTDAEAPVGTITAGGGGKTAVVAAHLSAYYGQGDGSSDRSASMEEPVRTVVTENRHAFVAAHLTKFSENSVGIEPDEPLHTVMAGAPRHGVVATFLAQHNTGMVGHAANEPVSTLTQRCTQQAIAAAHLVSLHGSDRRDQSAEKPAPTICAGGGHLAEVRAFLIKYYRTAIGQALDVPAHTITAEDRLGLVMVEGEPYEIADIGMRMLTPRELFRAQGFPDSYIIDRDAEGRAFTSTIAVRCCGNSVCPPMAAALVSANCADLAVTLEAAE